MQRVTDWTTVSRDAWSFSEKQQHVHVSVFSLKTLPNFSEPRFSHLAEQVDSRLAEVARRQLQSLQQLHGLGQQDNIGISLRIVKGGQGLTLYVVVRVAKDTPFSDPEVATWNHRVRTALPHEYSFEEESDTHAASAALDASWISEGAELFKSDDTYNANTVPFYYSVPLWSPNSNDMTAVCRSMLQTSAKVAIDITLVPTQFTRDERSWIDMTLRNLRDAQLGERLYADDGRTLLKQFPPMPLLKTPTDNYEELTKRYDKSRLFLCSVKVLGSGNIRDVVDTLATRATKTRSQYKYFPSGSGGLRTLQDSYSSVDIRPQVHTEFWKTTYPEDLPFRAQRLNRLADVEEIANFWRVPIRNIHDSFGFGLDTGLRTREPPGSAISKITLGTYTDELTQATASATLTSQQLVKHGLIVGVPGSGKTTTMFNILHQLWSAEAPEHRVPFIVLEPAKTEFRALKRIEPFTEDMLVFTLGDERTSPFRFNPFAVLPGISLESHVSRLNACFVGAFDLFDPLPMLLDQAIRQTYRTKGWFDDGVGGEPGMEAPTLSDLCAVATDVVNSSGYSDKLKDDFNASLLQRLNSLRRGSKGRMLDTGRSIPFDTLMTRPVVLELDSLNEDEKALMMMFVLSSVYEYCKVHRKSGDALSHLLVVEEAHNLIGSSGRSSDYRANPKEHTVNLFVKMLAEMRALGQGILIADQLPTAIAPQAVKQTNVKVLMRLTAKDDREEIGNTMDLEEAELKQVVHFKTGHAYIYHEELDRVRPLDMYNFKILHDVENPPDDAELHAAMGFFEQSHPDIYLPFDKCSMVCQTCNRRARSQSEAFVDRYFTTKGPNTYHSLVTSEHTQSHMSSGKTLLDALRFCAVFHSATKEEFHRLASQYHTQHAPFGPCTYIHALHSKHGAMLSCMATNKRCTCKNADIAPTIRMYATISQGADKAWDASRQSNES